MKHILILFTDQQRWDTVGALGNAHIQTPYLDALVRESVVFKRCNTPSPVCVPARLSMFSGQYPARTGCNNNNAENVYEGEGFYSRLTKSGYQSCAVGKMHHLIDPYGLMGFEKRWTQEELSDPRDHYTQFIQENYPWIIDYNGMRSEMYYVPQISQLPAKDHPSAWIADKSIDYINSCSSDKPMLLVSSFIHPHPPYCPPSPWQKLYRDDPPAPFEVPDEHNTFQDMTGKRSACERLMMSRQDILRSKNFYYACVSFVDYQIGRIIQALKDKGMYEDTLILFTSDHGDMMGDYGAMGKRTMVDSSCSVPFILRHPGKEHEERLDACSLVDVAPTLLSYAGIPYEEGAFDGVDL
ncbi:MAG: sulfatase-like hydrolase/transferase, partial [Clostridiales bacterium]|nr:sulfatase-like hydrolase/transferase [Clostridiales bacterium]